MRRCCQNRISACLAKLKFVYTSLCYSASHQEKHKLMAKENNPNGIKWSDVVKQAHSDDSFKQKLLKDPKAAIQEMTGVTLPANLKIVVHEQTDDTVHLVIPTTSTSATSPVAIFL